MRDIVKEMRDLANEPIVTGPEGRALLRKGAGEIERLRAGLESIVNCRNPLTRAAVREACAEILAASTVSPAVRGGE